MILSVDLRHEDVALYLIEKGFPADLQYQVLEVPGVQSLADPMRRSTGDTPGFNFLDPVFWQNFCQCDRLAPPSLGLAPPRLWNPGSATVDNGSMTNCIYINMFTSPTILFLAQKVWHLVQARASPRQVSKVIWRIPIGRSEVTSQGQTGYGGHRTRWTTCWWFPVSNRIISLVLERKQSHKNGETSFGLKSLLTSYIKNGPLIFLFKIFLEDIIPLWWDPGF